MKRDRSTVFTKKQLISGYVQWEHFNTTSGMESYAILSYTNEQYFVEIGVLGYHAHTTEVFGPNELTKAREFFKQSVLNK